MANMTGGFSETMDATEQTQKICDEVRNQVEEKTKKIYEEFKAVKYRSQIVAGQNFLIKVHVGGHTYLHLKVHQKLPCDGGEIILLDVQENHQLTSLLTSSDPVMMNVTPEGYSETADATAETQKICDELKDDVERRTQKTYVIYKALKYRQKLDDAGTTFLIKVHVGGDDHLHLKILQNPAGTKIILLDLQEKHSKDDPIIPF